MVTLNEVFKNVIKSVTCFKIIIFLRLFSGFYYKVSESRTICYLLRLYVIGFALFCVTYGYSVWHTLYTKFDIYMSLNYVFNVFFSFITSGEYFSKYCETIRINDAIMNYGDIPLVATYVNIIFLIAVIISLTVIISFLITFPSSFLETLCSSNMFSSPNIICMEVLIILSLLHTRMRKLREFLEKKTTSVVVIGGNEYSQRVRDVRKSLINYDNLLNNIQGVNKQLQILLMVGVVFYVPCLTYYFYYYIWNYFHEAESFVLAVYKWEAVLAAVLVFSPGIIAELILNEVENIKKTLNSTLISCTDESLRYELEIMEKYVSQRPFELMICGAVPLDGKLPIRIAALSLTFVVIAFQFSNNH